LGSGGVSAGGAAGTGGASTAGAAGAAGARDLGPLGPDGFAIEAVLASELKDTAPTTVGIVSFALGGMTPTEAHIDFGLDTAYGMTAPVELTLANHRTVLIGMKPERTYHFRIVATDGSTTSTSADHTLATGAATTLVPLQKPTVRLANGEDTGFIIGSFWQQDTRWTPFIVDTDGDVVWWYDDSAHLRGQDGIGRARLTADHRDIWLVNGQFSTPLRRVSLDTLDVQEYADAKGTHDVCAVSGDTMAYLATASSRCAQIVEIDKAGNQKTILDSTALTGDNCHGNAIRYSKQNDWYVFGDRNTDVYVIDRAGKLQWKLSDKTGGTQAWGGVQHGVQLLPSSVLLFSNEPTAGDWMTSQALEFGLDGSLLKTFTNRGGTDWFGDVQRLPSGSTLISYMGSLQIVDADDNVVFDLGTVGGSALAYVEFRKDLYGPALDVAP